MLGGRGRDYRRGSTLYTPLFCSLYFIPPRCYCSLHFIPLFFARYTSFPLDAFALYTLYPLDVFFISTLYTPWSFCFYTFYTLAFFFWTESVKRTGKIEPKLLYKWRQLGLGLKWRDYCKGSSQRGFCWKIVQRRLGQETAKNQAQIQLWACKKELNSK